MLFNSLHFLLFFIIVTVSYFSIPHKYRWFLLLSCSCYFYMVFMPIYILILGFTIVIDYFAGIFLEESTGKTKKWYLIGSLIANIGVLAIFKYYNFFNQNLTELMHGIGFQNPIPYLSILLPIGLSFHTFQAMSYTIEVYRGKQKAERHFGIYSLYVMFYPQLVAGPIERPQNLLHQFYEKHTFDYVRVTDGLKLMVWGLFKKVVIADRLAVLVNQVYENPTEYHGIQLIIATLFFSFQIYCDFSGYSDIAIGAAQVMGFKLMTNFNRPYFSKNISEFWKRWHISLSTWFKDYLYISLGGNKVSIPRWYFNLFFVFLVSGFWHGANWTFIIWGALHGFYLIFAIITQKYRDNFKKFVGIKEKSLLDKIIQIFVTFVLVWFAWIFFRAKNVSDAYYIITHLFDGIFENFNVSTLRQNISILGLDKIEFSIAIISIAFMEFIHYKQRNMKLRQKIAEQPNWIRWSFYYAAIFAIIIFGVFNKSQFIYFQF